MRLLSYIFACLFCASLAFIGFGRPLGFQWDFFAFYDAALSWRMGLNPYDFSQLASQLTLPHPPNLSFIYPPLTIFFFLPLSFLSQPLAAGAWVLVKCAFLALFLWACRSVHRFDWRDPGDSALLLFGFNSTLLWDFSSGNCSMPQFALVWLAFLCLEKRRDFLFALLIVAASTIKIQPIALLAAPLLLFRPVRWKPALAGSLLFAAYLAANKFLYPEMFAAFLQVAPSRMQGEGGILNPSALSLARDLLSQLSRISLLPESLRDFASSLALPLYGAFVLGIGSFTVARFWKNRNFLHAEAFSLFLLTYLLTVPRVKSYEFILILPAAAYALKRIQPSFRGALLLLLCLPVIFPIGESVPLEIFSSPQLGAIKKLQYLFYHYLPFGCTFLLWLWFQQRITGRALERGMNAG